MPEVSVGSSDFKVFADLDFADEFLAGDVMRATLWATRNGDAKGRGLTSATRMMLWLPWVSTPPDPADAEQPAIVQEVCAMLAADLLAKPKLFSDATGNSNVKTAKAGSAQVEFFRPVEGGPPIPLALWILLLNAGLVSLALDDGMNAGAIVSGISCGVRPEEGRYADYGWPGYAAEDTD